jgi:hypothetical protein
MRLASLASGDGARGSEANPSAMQLASRFGPPRASWAVTDREHRTIAALPGQTWTPAEGGGALSEDERAELEWLRGENAELTMQRDVLKRSVALWVHEAMGGR